MEKIALFLFNSSTYAVDPWLDRGVTCVSVDYDDTDHSAARDAVRSTDNHIRLSIDLSQVGAKYVVMRELAERGYEAGFIFSMAPCTSLAVSGAAHFQRKREEDPLFQEKAVTMAKLASTFGCPWIVENPVSVLSSMWQKPTAYFHPYMFSEYIPGPGIHPEAPDIFPAYDKYPKKTGLWSGGGAEMPVPDGSASEVAQFPAHTKLGGKSARTKHLRSLTPRGMAAAICLSNLHFVK